MRDDLILRVMGHGGLSADEARATIACVLAALRRELGRPEAEALAELLPDEFAAALRRNDDMRGDSLAARVALAEGVSYLEAREHTASVCCALSELLPEALSSRLRRAFSPETAALFEPPAPAADEAHLRPSRDTIAEGRPGSHRPLSEARPGVAQPNSVADANPHGDTKLSSSRGLTQEREHETLATGRPGPHRP